MSVGKISWEKALNVVVLLSGLGLFGWVKSEFKDSVSDEIKTQLKDPDSEISRLVKSEIDIISEAKVKTEINAQAQAFAIAEAFNGFRNMGTVELRDYLEGQFNFADSIRAKMPVIRKNHEWTAQQRARDENFTMCGYLLMGEVLQFVDCDGILREVHYGKLGNSQNKIYYYRDKEDNPIPISILSPKITIDAS